MIEVYNNKMTFNIDDVTDRFRVMMTTEWQNEMQTKPKLRTYKIFKNCLTVEPYVLYHVHNIVYVTLINENQSINQSINH